MRTRRDFLKGLLAVIAVPTTVVKAAVKVASTQKSVRELWSETRFIWAPYIPMYTLPPSMDKVLFLEGPSDEWWRKARLRIAEGD